VSRRHASPRPAHNQKHSSSWKTFNEKNLTAFSVSIHLFVFLIEKSEEKKGDKKLARGKRARSSNDRMSFGKSYEGN
jgi:hypothetical protein